MSSVSGGSPTNALPCFIVMGVSGSGKSSIGEALASRLGASFTDGDSLHPPGNIAKMSAKQPLTDEDRRPWLENIRSLIHRLNAENVTGVVVCSALKKHYRDTLRDGNRVHFIYLRTEFDVILERLKKREGHFMPVELLQSQFQTLEEPDDNEEDVTTVQVEDALGDVISKCCSVAREQLMLN